jgi:hypothetical protein
VGRREEWPVVQRHRLEELLDLIAMWEVRGDDWRRKAGETALYNQLVEAAPMYDSDGNVLDR